MFAFENCVKMLIIFHTYTVDISIGIFINLFGITIFTISNA